MGGGGGSSKKKKADDTPSTPTTPYERAPTSQTFQPYLPGFPDQIARQLQSGYGSEMGGLQDLLTNLYRPMTLMNYQEPISETQANYDPKKYAALNTGNPALDKLLMTKAEDDKNSRRR